MLKIKEVAELFKVTETTIYNWMRRENNPIPHYKKESTTRFDKNEVIEWFKTGEV